MPAHPVGRPAEVEPCLPEKPPQGPRPLSLLPGVAELSPAAPWALPPGAQGRPSATWEFETLSPRLQGGPAPGCLVVLKNGEADPLMLRVGDHHREVAGLGLVRAAARAGASEIRGEAQDAWGPSWYPAVQHQARQGSLGGSGVVRHRSRARPGRLASGPQGSVGDGQGWFCRVPGPVKVGEDPGPWVGSLTPTQLAGEE